MLTHRRRGILCAGALLLVCSGQLLADGGLSLTLQNDSSDNLLVSVYDQNTQPPSAVLANREIYGNASLSITLTAGNGGHGHLSWTAVTVSTDARRCGHGEARHLNDGDTVNVHTVGGCHRP
jgi:hypothetical protein